MRGFIEVSYEGDLHEEVLTYLSRDLGLIVKARHPLVVETADVARDLPLVLDAVKLVRAVGQVLVRQKSEDHALATRNGGC